MNIRKTLNELVKVVSEEAERNADFRMRLQLVLEQPTRPKTQPKQPTAVSVGDKGEGVRRAGNRRPEAVLDPIALIRQGEEVLREALRPLDVERLLDIVADYAMDPSKLVMKWKDRDRILERIVEVASSRERKGSAFRDQDNQPKE